MVTVAGMLKCKITTREALVCLAFVVLWTLVASWQALAVFPWNQGDGYVRAASVVDAGSEAVIVAVLTAWLLGRSGLGGLDTVRGGDGARGVVRVVSTSPRSDHTDRERPDRRGRRRLAR
jgi:membrane protease YdiL (CAAX protease family)